MLPRHGRLLPSQKTSAREVLFDRGVSDGANVRRGRRSELALEKTPRPHVRWIDGIDARYSGESTSLSASLQSDARCRLSHRTDRGGTLVVVTTLLDPEEFAKSDLADLYRARWNQELDLRSIKITLQMDVLRCKSPELVRKEIWTHILAYNLIRTIMAQAATKYGIEPRSISFKGTLQTLEAFQPLIDFQGQRGSSFRMNLYQRLLNAIAVHRVADRPDRFEPRQKKRRPKKYFYLKKSRHEAKRDMLKGLN